MQRPISTGKPWLSRFYGLSLAECAREKVPCYMGMATHESLYGNFGAYPPHCRQQTSERAIVVACLALHGARLSHPAMTKYEGGVHALSEAGPGGVQSCSCFTRRPGKGATHTKCYAIHCQNHSCMARLVGGGPPRWCELWQGLLWCGATACTGGEVAVYKRTRRNRA
jgi:hypothetical protein